MMLSMLGFSAPQPFGKKAQLKAQKQASMAHVPRTLSVQTQTLTAQSAPTYYAFSGSGSYVLDSQRPSHGYIGQPTTKKVPGFAQAAAPQYISATTSAVRSEYKPLSSGHQIVSGDRTDSKSNAGNRFYKILPTHLPDSFVYERSEDAQSDTLTNYSSSSLDTPTQSTTTATSTTISRPEMSGRGNSVLMITNACPGDAVTSSSVPSPPDSPHPPSVSLPPSSSSLSANSQGRPVPRSGEDVVRPRTGSGDSGSSHRRGSVSDSEKPSIFPSGPSPSRSSPPRAGPGCRLSDRTPREGFAPEANDPRPAYRAPNVVPVSIVGPRDVPPVRRDSDSRMQVDTPRNRRLSGAVVPPGFGPGERHSPPNARDATAPGMRSAPSGEGKRERHSPDRDIGPGPEFAAVHERRLSGAAALPRPPPGSFYHSSGSGSSGSASSRERHSPQEEMPRGVGFAAGPPVSVPVRSRTLSSGRRDDVPKQIVITGVEAVAQGPGRTVRFSERLICPSPIPLDRRRKGWFNKRGDQLWTNDGVFVAAEPGAEFPVDLNEYPDVGTGWMNEEGIRIDMQHRLVPKVPLRPALKRSNTSSSSAGAPQQQQLAVTRPENRAFYSSTTIREEN